MIHVTLSKEDLVHIIKGCHVDYEQMRWSIVKDNGSFSGSYGRWSWDHSAFEDPKYTEEVLWVLYKRLVA